MRAVLGVLVLAYASTCQAQVTYTIKPKIHADAGKTLKYHTHSVDKGSMKVFAADGKLLAEHKKESTETSYRVTILERAKDGRATKYIRVYDKAEETEDGKSKSFSFAGRTVLFETVGDKVRVGVVGTPPLEAKDAAKLQKDANRKSRGEALLRHLSPGKPVKIGHSWSMPVKELAEMLDDMTIDQAKSSATAKLVKVYAKDKSQFGQFEVVIKFALTGSTEEEGTLTFDPAGTLSAHMKIDVAIDGSTTERSESGTMTMSGEAAMASNGMKFRLVFDVRGEGGDEHSAEIDDPKARLAPKVTFAAGPGEWAEFKDKEFGFTAKFPGTPERKANTNKSGVTTTEFGVETEGRKVWHAVTVSDYPADQFKIDAATVYGNLRKTPNIKETRDLEIAGFPGLEMKQDVKKEKIVHVTQRIVVVGQRMYQLLVVAEEGKTPNAQQFFDSFQLNEKPPPKKDK